jgi:hypothetical protein
VGFGLSATYIRNQHLAIGQAGPHDIAACEFAFDEAIDGVWASDHAGLVADFSGPSRDVTA